MKCVCFYYEVCVLWWLHGNGRVVGAFVWQVFLFQERYLNRTGQGSGSRWDRVQSTADKSTDDPGRKTKRDKSCRDSWVLAFRLNYPCPQPECWRVLAQSDITLKIYFSGKHTTEQWTCLCSVSLFGLRLNYLSTSPRSPFRTDCYLWIKPEPYFPPPFSCFIFFCCRGLPLIPRFWLSETCDVPNNDVMIFVGGGMTSSLQTAKDWHPSVTEASRHWGQRRVHPRHLHNPYLQSSPSEDLICD